MTFEFIESNLHAIQIQIATRTPFKFIKSNLHTIQIYWDQPPRYSNSLRALPMPFKFIESKLYAIEIHWQRPTSVAVTTGSSGQVVETIYPGLFVKIGTYPPGEKNYP